MRASYRQAIVALLTVGQLAISGKMFAETAELILYRLFLVEGDRLVRYGGYAEVGNRATTSAERSTCGAPNRCRPSPSNAMQT